MIAVSIIIPTYNRPLLLKQCLEALVPQLHKADEVIVINNSSTYPAKTIVKNFQYQARVIYLRARQKNNPSAARNIGIRYAKGSVLAFLDDDSVVKKSWLKQVKASILTDPSSNQKVYQGQITHFFPQKTLLTNLFFLRHKRALQHLSKLNSWKKGKPLNFIIACNFFLRRSVLAALDYVFDEQLFPFVGEERDLAYRLQLAGYPIVYAPSVRITHKKQTPSMKNFLFRTAQYGKSQGILEKKYLTKQKINRLFPKIVAQQNPIFGNSIPLARHFLSQGFFIYFSALTTLLLQELTFSLGTVYGHFYYQLYQDKYR